MKAKSIDEYISLAPSALHERLWSLHEAIASSAPGASEALKWRMPAYSYDKILVAWAVFKHHTGFYPMPSAIKSFKKELAKYKTAEGSVQFPHDKALPLPLIKKMVKFRVKESNEGTIKWRQ